MTFFINQSDGTIRKCDVRSQDLNDAILLAHACVCQGEEETAIRITAEGGTILTSAIELDDIFECPPTRGGVPLASFLSE
jgi:hypothetical protein